MTRLQVNKKALKLAIRVLVVFIIIYFAGDYLYQQREALTGYHFTLHSGLLILSFIALMVYNVVIISIWRHILKTLGAEVNLWKLVRVKTYSELARYAPGKVWHFVSAVYYLRKEGVKTPVALISKFLDLGMSVLSGFIFFLLILPLITAASIGAQLGLYLLTIAFVVFVSHPIILKRIILIFEKLFKRNLAIVLPSHRCLLTSFFAYLLTWIANGLAVWLLIKSVYPQIIFGDLFELAGIYAVAWALGVISIISPSGIGIREAALVFLLDYSFPVSVAILIAVVTRIWSTLAELLLAGIIALFDWQSKKRRINERVTS